MISNMNKKSFTLTELLIAVVIMGILASVLYPNYNAFILKAKLKEVENTVETIKAAERYYRFKIEDWYVWVWDDVVDGYIKNSDGSADNIEEILHITIPKGDDAICQYRFFIYNGEGICAFRAQESDGVWRRQGFYNMARDAYKIDNNCEFKAYLKYLEQ